MFIRPRSLTSCYQRTKRTTTTNATDRDEQLYDLFQDHHYVDDLLLFVLLPLVHCVTMRTLLLLFRAVLYGDLSRSSSFDTSVIVSPAPNLPLAQRFISTDVPSTSTSAPLGPLRNKTVRVVNTVNSPSASSQPVPAPFTCAVTLYSPWLCSVPVPPVPPSSPLIISVPTF